MELSCVMYGNVESEVDGGLDDENENIGRIVGGFVSLAGFASGVRGWPRIRGCSSARTTGFTRRTRVSGQSGSTGTSCTGRT